MSLHTNNARFIDIPSIVVLVLMIGLAAMAILL